MQHYYQPLPTNSVVTRLNELSCLLGWGRLTLKCHANDQVTDLISRPWISMWWESELISRMQLVVSPYCVAVHRTQIDAAEDAFAWFVLFTFGSYPIKAGRLRIRLPSKRKIAALAVALRPMFLAQHFATQRTRNQLLKRFPECNLESANRDSSVMYHLVGGQIAVDERGDIPMLGLNRN